MSFWALLALIVVGIVLIFVHIPGGVLIFSVLGLVIFAGFTMFDFQRLRTNTDIAAAAVAGGVDLPRRAERVPVLPSDLLRRGAVIGGAKKVGLDLMGRLLAASRPGAGPFPDRNGSGWSAGYAQNPVTEPHLPVVRRRRLVPVVTPPVVAVRR